LAWSDFALAGKTRAHSRNKKAVKNYRSSIPKKSEERVVMAFPSGAKEKTQYWLDGELRGTRQFDESGACVLENPLKNGLTHGRLYYLDGQVTFSQPYVKGRPHGVAKQYHDGQLIGAFAMHHGTGIDLWRLVREGKVILAEARYLQNGQWHGYEWWITEDQRKVWRENHFFENEPHGIERRWTVGQETFRRGYPKYWIHGKAVEKRQYLAAAKKDQTLPPFHEKDDKPTRVFPSEVTKHLMPVVKKKPSRRLK
jgi:antitoxin component YwqK of YwqJK toxin-antitoxin module